jgi:hypothetical protein
MQNGVLLDFYDVAFDSCNVTKALESSLGYKRIFLSKKDIDIIDGNSKYEKDDIENSIFIDFGKESINSIIKMNPSAIVFANLRLDKKAMENMRENDVALCIPTSMITSTYALQRSKTLYWTSRLFKYAKSIKLNVSFATLAKSNIHLCSYIQLVELAKLLDDDEKYIKHCISETNKSLVRVKA